MISRQQATHTVGGEGAAADEARRIVEYFVDESAVPGMSLAVASPDGRPDRPSRPALQTSARADAATAADQYPWFSMTKIATATAAMQLARDRSPRPRRTDRRPTYRPTDRHDASTATRAHVSCWDTRPGWPTRMPVRWIRPEDAAGRPRAPLGASSSGTAPRAARWAPARYSNVGYLLVGDAHRGRHQDARCRIRSPRPCSSPLGMTATGYHFASRSPGSTGHVRLPAAAPAGPPPVPAR